MPCCCDSRCFEFPAYALQALHALRKRERELTSEIAGGQGQARNLGARTRVLEEQLARQGEVMYNVDLGLQVCSLGCLASGLIGWPAASQFGRKNHALH
jgi:hypothetical protein